ncbi:MAG: PilZ domain-containing protein [Candidatus Omnitrophota bacterium]|nr:PilZ domain-containing protein [Candidatus Omnitrophota bacterium]
MEEQRCAARWKINQEADLCVDEGIKSIPCVVEDISSRGMRVSLGKDLFPDVFANFNLTLSDDFTFNAGAQVAWAEKIYEKNVYGLSFSRIEESTKNRICRYVQDNFPTEMTKQAWSGI